MEIVALKESVKSTFTYDEIYPEVLAYFKGDELAANAWIGKYSLKNGDGDILERTPDEMHKRLASELARIEAKYPNGLSESQIFDLLKDFKYIVPQGSPMSGIGNDHQIVSLSNCFVIGPGNGNSDSYGSILKADEEQVQLMKRRGGVGHDLSHIRPGGSPVKNSALTSTGVVPFMERYSSTTREVAQDGRRGALMLSIDIKHPDSEHFIDAKVDQTKVTGANVSVKVSDEFMRAVEAGESFTQQFPIDSAIPKVKKDIDAKELWNKIIFNAWKSAEPGVLFWDKVLSESVPDCYADFGFKTVSTNPCGEIPLCPYDSCRLVAVNLFSYVENPFTDEAYFDFEKFAEHVGYAQRFMDDIVDLEIEKIDRILEKIKSDPEPDEVKDTEFNLWGKIRNKALEGRRTGLGITGEGDMLAALGIQYGTDEGNDFAVKVQKALALAAYRSSVDMAKERGAFEIFDHELELDNPFINRIKEADPGLYEDMVKFGRRNIALLTIAPTGTTSLMTQTTSGIEPAFQVAYMRRKKVNPSDQNARVDFTDEVGDTWQHFFVLHHKFKMWLTKQGLSNEEIELLSEDELNEYIAKSPYAGATSNDVDWVKKVEMQGRMQEWVDHSISVTVNVPEETSTQVIEDIYLAGWKSGCKGMTVYRDGSRSGVLVSNDKADDKEEHFAESYAPKRPVELEAKVVRFNNNAEKWIAVIGLLDGKPYEIFTGLAEDSFMLPKSIEKGTVVKALDMDGNKRYDFRYTDGHGYNVTIEGLSRSFNPEFWNYAILISGMLRHGMPLEHAVNLIEKLHLPDESLNTWKMGAVRALRKMIPEGVKPQDTTCPECGEDALIYEEGCLNCKSCGHSKCG